MSILMSLPPSAISPSHHIVLFLPNDANIFSGMIRCSTDLTRHSIRFIASSITDACLGKGCHDRNNISNKSVHSCRETTFVASFNFYNPFSRNQRVHVELPLCYESCAIYSSLKQTDKRHIMQEGAHYHPPRRFFLMLHE